MGSRALTGTGTPGATLVADWRAPCSTIRAPLRAEWTRDQTRLAFAFAGLNGVSQAILSAQVMTLYILMVEGDSKVRVGLNCWIVIVADAPP